MCHSALTSCRAVAKEANDSNCPDSCPGNGRVVCGNDGNDYASECQLRMIACKDPQQGLEVESEGRCPEGVHHNEHGGHEFEPVPDQDDDEKGAVDFDNQRSDEEDLCSAQIVCPKHLNKVCGSDGKTYDNKVSGRADLMNIPVWKCPDTIKAPFYKRLEMNEHSMSPMGSANDEKPNCSVYWMLRPTVKTKVSSRSLTESVRLRVG